MSQVQHSVPQKDTHEIEVITVERGGVGRMVCKQCGKRVTVFRDSEGPEGLKALFRL